MRLSSLQTESKREEFRRYLEGAGVLDAFTKGSCCCWLLTISLLSLILLQFLWACMKSQRNLQMHWSIQNIP